MPAMTSSSDNTEVVALASCREQLARDDSSTEEVTFEVHMFSHLVAAKHEAGVMGGTGMSWATRWAGRGNMNGYYDFMGRHTKSAALWEAARYGVPVPRQLADVPSGTIEISAACWERRCGSGLFLNADELQLRSEDQESGPYEAPKVCLLADSAKDQHTLYVGPLLDLHKRMANAA